VAQGPSLALLANAGTRVRGRSRVRATVPRCRCQASLRAQLWHRRTRTPRLPPFDRHRTTVARCHCAARALGTLILGWGMTVARCRRRTRVVGTRAGGRQWFSIWRKLHPRRDLGRQRQRYRGTVASRPAFAWQGKPGRAGNGAGVPDSRIWTVPLCAETGRFVERAGLEP
jgi:hypothetical protein